MGLPNTKTQIFTFFILLSFQVFPIVCTFPHLPNLFRPGQKPEPEQPQNLGPRDVFRSEQQEFLDAHNKARAHVGQPFYVWNETLASYALAWASQRISDCRMIHSYGPYGENIFWGGRDHWTAAEAVRSWVKEHRFYNRRTNACLPGRLCGHYTQIVWRDSIQLGCARVKCLNGGIFILCSYYPPGNYVNENPFFPNSGNDDSDDSNDEQQS